MDNRAVSLRQLQRIYGLSYGKIRKLVKLPGFPIVEGVVFPKDFDEWRKEHYRSQHTASALQLDAGRKAGESVLRSGLLAFLHLGLAHQLGEVLSLL